MVNEFGSWKWTISHIFSMHLHITLLLIHLLLYPLKETHQDLITTMEEICRPQTINIITGCIVDQQLRLKDVLHKLPDITSSVHLFRLWSIESVLGEIQVVKVDFRVDLVGIWTLFGSQPPYPPTFGRNLPKKSVFIFGAPLNDHVQWDHYWVQAAVMVKIRTFKLNPDLFRTTFWTFPDL